MAIWVCPECGLVQSRAGGPRPERVRTLSTDADWGNVRHGKGVRFAVLRDLIGELVDWSQVRRALDVGSNRGDFILWAHAEHPETELWAVEPDAGVVEDYRELPGLHLILDRIEHLALPDQAFDLVFCSHTLEHAASAAAMLRQMHDCLRPGGWLVLEIPNIAAIALPDTVEEFFIDKHTFHFDRDTLLDFVRQSGYEVVRGAEDQDPLNITLLLRRAGPAVVYRPADGAARARRHDAWIAGYGPRLSENRALLRRLVDEKLRPLGQRQKVAYWGAGRIFDALVKYGGLQAENVYMLVDRHLHGIVAQTHGVAIDKPERLRIREPQVCVVLGRSGEEAMARAAYAFGVRHVLKFSELLEQVRDVPATLPMQP